MTALARCWNWAAACHPAARCAACAARPRLPGTVAPPPPQHAGPPRWAPPWVLQPPLGSLPLAPQPDPRPRPLHSVLGAAGRPSSHPPQPRPPTWLHRPAVEHRAAGREAANSKHAHAGAPCTQPGVQAAFSWPTWLALREPSSASRSRLVTGRPHPCSTDSAISAGPGTATTDASCRGDVWAWPAGQTRVHKAAGQTRGKPSRVCCKSRLVRAVKQASKLWQLAGWT